MMKIDEIYELLGKLNVDPVEFWAHAMGGDRHDMPREDVERVLGEMEQ